ncbi:3-oxoacyl-[acyl-carrier-protein] synthase [Renibacterium salmoninarum ATCC 33209]|uniref:3-oxoacyl-[acyl-carrier-protein] synthase n=1 Tax=Renibacterium salmoninarum (strain ATCC 33209 / DSM 20767 / JCM 11484 / NBRC 15589 / NCIMB 2235) TaxID=288705 RepID=A9WUE6_RENSM|nr:3-oxoacyl-[acyl-carrier-protein] synthase [Renibacterium salmoninarum ATCC 33209]
MATHERVAITGLGAITPQGRSADQMWQNMRSGVPGVKKLDPTWAAELPVQIAGTVDAGFEESLSVREQRRLDRVE